MAAALLCVAAGMTACGAAPSQNHPNPVRRSLESSLAAARNGDLVLRWNPAPCACPPFEIRLGERWIRAELYPATADVAGYAEWLQALSALAVEALPVAVSATGKAEGELVRTANGLYAVRVEVAAVAMLPDDPARPSDPDRTGAPARPSDPARTGAPAPKQAPAPPNDTAPPSPPLPAAPPPANDTGPAPSTAPRPTLW